MHIEKADHWTKKFVCELPDSQFGILSVLNGKLVYAKGRGTKHSVVCGDETINPNGDISELFVSNGKLHLCVQRGKEYYLICGAEEFGPYESKPFLPCPGSLHEGDFFTPSFIVYEGKPLFCAERGEALYAIWGVEEFGPHKSLIEDLSVVAGKPLFCAWHDGKSRVMLGDRRISDRYDSEWQPTSSNGKPLFCAKRDNTYFIVWGEQELVSSDVPLSSPYRHEGELFYCKRVDLVETCPIFSPVWRGETLGRYALIENLSIHEGKLLFSASGTNNGRWHYVVYGDEKSDTFSECVWNVLIYQGKPLFCAEDQDGQFVVWGNEVQIEAHEEVFGLGIRDGIASFFVLQGDRIFKLTHRAV